MNTSDILRLLEHFGVRENEVSYGNDSIIFPTICHNELINNPSHKLYYYESSKRFYCYTNCKAMNVFGIYYKCISSERSKSNLFSSLYFIRWNSKE